MSSFKVHPVVNVEIYVQLDTCLIFGDIGEAKRNSRISSARRRQHSAFGISSLECPAVFCSKTLPKDEEGPSVLPSPCSSEASRPFNCLLISNVSTIVQFSQFTEPFNPYRLLEIPHSDILYMLIFFNLLKPTIGQINFLYIFIFNHSTQKFFSFLK
ncbi:uncharacterized protein LOC122716925 [Apis laboriosa]|uniref:uncharacterized protein LOC122716925 n=1 Tax=Apis laboriosa TaxID=183418 RepID=UPI001CC5CE0F|nr:uncharacterized protein LOC122716925 [Apis laboriosa]